MPGRTSSGGFGWSSGRPSRPNRRRTKSCPRERSWTPSKPIEGDVPDRVLAPVLVVEVPPLARIRRESLRFHCPPQHHAPPALRRRSARIIGERPVGALIVRAGHLDGLAGRQIVEREVHGLAAIVA